MPERDPSVIGADLSKRLPGGQMTRGQEAAHARLASLPTYKHRQEPRVSEQMARERSEKAARTKKNRGTLTKGSAIALDGSRPAQPRRKK